VQPALATECQERKILEGRYRADRRVYLSAVRDLHEHLNKAEFDQAYANAERAKVAFESSRDALDVHMQVHGCAPLGD
jgi:Spy/CpxP family protein refolding chaperone